MPVNIFLKTRKKKKCLRQPSFKQLNCILKKMSFLLSASLAQECNTYSDSGRSTPGPYCDIPMPLNGQCIFKGFVSSHECPESFASSLF